MFRSTSTLSIDWYSLNAQHIRRSLKGRKVSCGNMTDFCFNVYLTVTELCEYRLLTISMSLSSRGWQLGSLTLLSCWDKKKRSHHFCSSRWDSSHLFLRKSLKDSQSDVYMCCLFFLWGHVFLTFTPLLPLSFLNSWIGKDFSHPFTFYIAYTLKVGDNQSYSHLWAIWSLQFT